MSRNILSNVHVAADTEHMLIQIDISTCQDPCSPEDPGTDYQI